MNVCDFNRSYMTWVAPYNPNDHRKPGHMPWGNSARIQFDARCELVDEKNGEMEEFFLITPCRTEWMYRPDTLFQTPNREYCGIWSRTEFIGVGANVVHGKAQSGTPQIIADVFTDFRLTVRNYPQPRVLEDDNQIIQATHDDIPLVGRTEIWDEARGFRATMEYPIKTMNINPQRERFQVDTGPLAFPDLSCTAERVIEWFSVAFVCYNTFDSAEFILRKPTPILDGDKEVASVIDYSEIRRMKAKNTVIAAEDATTD